MGGKKFDDNKPRMDLISPRTQLAMANVLRLGAEKYDHRNWEKGLDFGRVYASLDRHMKAWWGGQDIDPETEMNHLHHAACCIMFLQHYVIHKDRYQDYDDRPNYDAPLTTKELDEMVRGSITIQRD